LQRSKNRTGNNVMIYKTFCRNTWKTRKTDM
jgi:hypothetical protein